jgi:hypothetical protein
VYSNVHQGSIKGGKFLEQVTDYQLFKMSLLRGVSVFKESAVDNICN